MDYSDNGRIIKPKPPHSQNSDVDSDEFKRLDKIFKYMLNNKGKSFKAKKEDEELYYSDVEETRTQFTQNVLDTIKDKYNIPISTKVTFLPNKWICSANSTPIKPPPITTTLVAFSSFACMVSR